MDGREEVVIVYFKVLFW